MALVSCIRGFDNIILPIIAIDGTFLKEKYCEILFVTNRDGKSLRTHGALTQPAQLNLGKKLVQG